MSNSYQPTDEQLQALTMALSRQSFKIVAYAGAGKTTTLNLIGHALKGRGLYLAFNKAIAQEAKQKFSHHIDCRTFHSLAFRHTNKNITEKLKLPRFSPNRLAQDLGLKSIKMTQNDGQTLFLTPERQAQLVSDAVSYFCRTSASYPAPRHVKIPFRVSAADELDLQQALYPFVEKRWLQSIDPQHLAGIGHDIYLKLWALSNPIIPADFILFDEAQDADPLMMGILGKQSCQVIYVGDAHQQIYEWRGAINAMKNLPLPQTLLTQSFRFGEKVADIANLLLQGLHETVPLRGNPHVSSIVERLSLHDKKDAILCRTNASAMLKVLVGQKNGHKIALQADTERLLKFCHAAERLKQGQAAIGVPELLYFNHWREVQGYADTHEGSDLKTLVNLVDDYGSKIIEKAIQKLVTPEQADYLISTAHKAKGLEWLRVQINDDFQYETSQQAIKISPEELRLLYVACTRAKNHLDIHHLQDLFKSLKNKRKIIYQ